MVIIGAFLPAFSSSPSSLFLLLLLLAIQSCHETRARVGQDASSARAAGLFGDVWNSFFGDDTKTTPPPPPSSPDYGGGSSDLVALLANYTATTSGSAPADARRFRVLQYNIKQMPNNVLTRLAGDTEVDQKRRRKELLKALGQLGGGSTSARSAAAAAAAAEIPDVIVLNEVFTSAAQEAVEKLVDIFPYQTNVVGNDCPAVFDESRGKSWDSVSGDCRVFTATRGGVQIISRHPIEEVHAYVFETREGYFSGGRYINRGVVLVKVMVPPAGRCKDGDNTNDNNNNNNSKNNNNNNTNNTTNGGSTCERRPVWVMGTHLTSAIKNADLRKRQALEITEWIDDGVNKGNFDISRTEDLVIFGGDFNVLVKQNGEEFGNLTEKLKLAVNFTSVGPFGTDSYSPATNLEAKRAKTGDGNDTFDLIGYKTDFRRPVYAPYQQALQLKAEKAWYWERMEDNNGYYKDISDHYPVVADFYY